jgi:DNA polymerase-3 subunit alpha
MSSLIPQERGFLWPIKDVIYGNEEKDRRPVAPFIREVNNYPGLLDIIQSIEGSNYTGPLYLFY